MAKNADPDAYTLLRSAFAADGRIDVDDGVHEPYALVPVSPSIKTLLAYHTGFLETVVGETEESVIADRTVNFLGMISDVLDIKAGDETGVAGVRSFTVEHEPGVHSWKSFLYKVDVYGKFHSLCINNWFDVPENEHMTQETSGLYLRKHGLLAVLEDARLLRADGMVAQLRQKHVYVPLHQPASEMYKVVRPESGI